MGMRSLSAGTILGVLRHCDRDRDNVRITLRVDGQHVPRAFVLPASLSRHAIERIIAQNVADAFPAGASSITIERTARFTEVGI
jgi:hypothetical protein